MRFVLPLLLLCTLPAWAENVRVAVARGSSLRIEGRSVSISAGGDAPAKPVAAPLSLEMVGPFVSTGDQLEPKFVIADANGELTINGVPLIGSAEVVIDKGALVAIDVVELERYVASVVGSEMPPEWPAGALQAQAVATRTYVLQKHRTEHPGVPYDVEATVISQVYKGRQSLAASSLAAAHATEGKVLTYEGKLIEAYFFASCAGTTENALDAFGHSAPYLQPASCGLSASDPVVAWTRRIPLANASKLLQARGAIRGELKSVAVESKTGTGRVAVARLVSSDGSRLVTGADFRRLFGYSTLPSLDVTVRVSGGALVFSGRGAGHGVGLCQWCSREMAQHGRSAAEILRHFYPGTQIQPLTEALLASKP